MDALKFVRGFRLRSLGKAIALKEKIGAADRGVLKVALMVAALDGRITDDEYLTFAHMAKKCRGYREGDESRLLDEALRSAGFLMLKASMVSDVVLAKAFVAEAKAALPVGFADYSLADLRRAIVTWIAMGMSDGDYSSRERKCIEALRRAVAETRVSRAQLSEERDLMLSPVLRQACGVGNAVKSGRIELVSREFVTRVEGLIARLGDDAAASEELKSLVETGK